MQNKFVMLIFLQSCTYTVFFTGQVPKERVEVHRRLGNRVPEAGMDGKYVSLGLEICVAEARISEWSLAQWNSIRNFPRLITDSLVVKKRMTNYWPPARHKKWPIVFMHDRPSCSCLSTLASQIPRPRSIFAKTITGPVALHADVVCAVPHAIDKIGQRVHLRKLF